MSEIEKAMTIGQAIHRIEIHRDIHRLGEPQSIFIGKALDMAVSALREKQEHRWVPVSESPPKFDGEYLCTVKTKSGFKGIAPDVIQVVTMVWVSNTWKNEWFQIVPFYDVLAWKPLPEPYKWSKDDG